MLKISNLHKSYGKNEILKGINLEVKKGEILVILGPSGCGKSTLLRCINGLEEINLGEIYFKNEKITNTNLRQIRQKIGMVFQSYDLFSHKNVLENIILAPTIVQKRNKIEVIKEAKELLEKVKLSEKINSYPRELSGGQKQRVAIVRALCMRPEIMLFDEVTAALDPEMVREVLDVMLNLADNGLTMLIVTHEMCFARAIADKIIFLDNGTIVESGSPDEFFTQPKTLRAKEFLKTFEFKKVKKDNL